MWKHCVLPSPYLEAAYKFVCGTHIGVVSILCLEHLLLYAACMTGDLQLAH